MSGGAAPFGALQGVKVIELAHIMAGPVCGMMLADMGADVLKVEKPNGDDSRRMVPPTIEGESARPPVAEKERVVSAEENVAFKVPRVLREPA